MMRCPQCGEGRYFALDAVEYVTVYVQQIHERTRFYAPGELEVTDIGRDVGPWWDIHHAICRCRTCECTAPLWRFTIGGSLIDASAT